MNQYDILKEYENKEISYKEFCKVLDLPYLNGKAKLLQLNKIKSFVDIRQQNRKIYIGKIYTQEEIDFNNNKKFLQHKNNNN